MRRYKPAECNGLFIPVVLDEQIQPAGAAWTARGLRQSPSKQATAREGLTAYVDSPANASD